MNNSINSRKTITFLNHSSFIISTNTTNILCDPWFNGLAFHNGWSLLHDNSHDINQLNFDYIWISHEHPDHFSIPTLSRLTKKTTFLFQKTLDKKLKCYLEDKKHKVIELENKVEYQFKDLKITNIICDGFDSVLVVEYPDKSILLNINDARVDLNNHIENEILPCLRCRQVDTMMFQYSYANWAGNIDDKKTPTFQQKIWDKKNDYAISKLQPKYIIPFASFIYFCHKENAHWNQYDWLQHIYFKYKDYESKLIIPQPNQIINISENLQNKLNINNLKALKYWKNKKKFAKLKVDTQSVTIDCLKAEYKNFHTLLKKKNKLIGLVKREKNFLLSVDIFDLKLNLKIGLFQELFEVSESCNQVYHVSLSSEMLLLLFAKQYARGTLTVNGRITFNYTYAHLFFLFFFISYANNIGCIFNCPNDLNITKLKSILNNLVIMSILNENYLHKKVILRDINTFNKIYKQ
ncbi:MAG: MBL fold metallo-hydrolase [Verrucomicrobiota bacterium]